MAHKRIKPYKLGKLPDLPWTPWVGVDIESAQRPERREKKGRKTTKAWQILTGDRVQLLEGKDKGKQGKVVKVERPKNLVYVEGLNAEVHYQEGHGCYKSLPVDVNDVSVVDPVDNRPCTIVQRYTDQGEKVRVSTRTGRIIPKPQRKIKPKEAYKDGSYDTPSDVALENTYVPSLLYFHEEILLSLNVKPTIRKQELDKRDLILQYLQKEERQDSALSDEQQITVYTPGLYIRTIVYFMDVISRVKKYFIGKK